MTPRTINAIKALPYYHKKIGLVKALSLTSKFLSGNYSIIKQEGFSIHPIYLRAGTSDDLIFHNIFAFEEYLLKYVHFSPQTIIDCGANIGLFSVYMKNKYPHSKIIAVEPDADNFKMLTKNTEKFAGVKLYNNGIWSSASKLKVYDKFEGGKWALVVEPIKEDIVPKDVLVIESVSISQIFEENNIEVLDILKIDIETSEKEIFSKSFESWIGKVKVFVIEFHDWLEKGTASPFFKAITKNIEEFSFYIRGENVIIVNEALM